VYQVHLSRPAVMVENELAIEGWHSNTVNARLISSPLPLRTWRLAAGNYSFTASYQEPDRGFQYGAVVVALLAWLASVGLIVRRRQRRARPEASAPAKDD
jgi:hypothetical protein